MAVIAPDASKAATMTSAGEMTCISFPITKVEETADGDLMVTGTASDGSVDSDDQIVDPEWSQKGPGGFQDWFDTAGNVRVQHQAMRDPAGKGVNVEFMRDSSIVKSLVVEPVAKELVRKGILTAYSVGIANPVIVRDPVARGGRIKGGQIVELSLVDRPANKNCGIQLVKAAVGGTPEFTGKVFGAAGVLDKPAEPAVTKDKGVTVTLPKSLRVSVSPKDLAKLATFKQGLVTKGATPAAAKAVEPDPADGALSKAFAAEAAVYKRDIDTATRRRLASEGHALPDLSYPIETTGDLANAAHLAQSGHGDVRAATALIGREARLRGVPNPMKKPKKGSGKATKGHKVTGGHFITEQEARDAARSAKAAKCACAGGMMDGKPCTMCKAGKRMAKQAAKASAANKGSYTRDDFARNVMDHLHGLEEADAKKGKGKLRALCPGCGAKQNKKHVHCTECGQQLPPMPPMVAKNHDFMCLGCGTDLDKGERHCPQCGKENPGYNAMADMKIPANEAVKARKDRVAKAKKKGKKTGKEPFGGQRAMPFGKDKDDAEGGDGGKKMPAKKTAKAKTSTKGMKPGKGKKKKPGAGSKPTPAEAGGVPGQHDMPAPPHREPDGAEIENFERDAHIQDGDNEKPTAIESRTLKSADPEAAAALTLKNLDVPQHLGALHALTCPAYDPDAVAKAFPHASFTAIDLPEWRNGALEKAASAPLEEAQGAMELYNSAVTLKAADVHTLAGLRDAAHKAFRDANPGPGSFPEPGQISPTRFNRPYISDGHGAASPGHMGPHNAKIPEEGGIVSTGYQRPYLDAGHASESPDNQHTPGPMQAPPSTGVPTSEPARGFMSSNGIASMQHAMSAMHDHLSRRFPDVCPMEASLHIGSNPVPVPAGVPAPSKAPGARKAAKAAKRAKVKARKAAKVKAQKVAARRRRVERRVLKGAMSVEAGRVKLGMEPITPVAPPESPASKGAAAPLLAAIDPDALKAALTEATAPLVARLGKARKTAKAQDKALRKLRKTTDAIASQPDTSQSPMRMTALTKSTASAAPAAPQTVTGSAEQAQVTKMQLLQHQWRNSPDPSQREAAYGELTQMLGVNSMTPPQPVPVR